MEVDAGLGVDSACVMPRSRSRRSAPPLEYEVSKLVLRAALGYKSWVAKHDEETLAVHLLESEQVLGMVTSIEESTRATQHGVARFVEPAQGTLRRAISRRHHIVFGRRGSGKTSLLRKAAAELTVDRRPIAFIDLEPFKGHTYPDVLLSVLISTFEAFATWLSDAGRAPSNKKSLTQVSWLSRRWAQLLPEPRATVPQSLLAR